LCLKQYLEDLCRDFSMMLSSEDHPERVIIVEGIEIMLPAVTAIPLGFIANELTTNAAKYGAGRITVSLEPNPEKGYRCRSPTMARVCRRDSIPPLAKDWE
jgi:two-component system, sensor histidine kinase PdtaS